MRVVEDPDRVASHPVVSLSIGDFDGVHRGHQWLLSQTVGLARREGLLAAAITFRPDPREVLRPQEPLVLLTSSGEKTHLLAAVGLELLRIKRFTLELSQFTAQQFFAALGEEIQIRHLVVGPDFALGRGRHGTVPVVREIGRQMGFLLHVVAPLLVDGEEVRSTEIRRLVLAGAVDRAAVWLGRWPTLYGKVVEGERRGQWLGFRTANLALTEPLAVPADGVYAALAEVAPFTPLVHRWPSVINIGVRPTFRGRERTIETHLLGFEGDLYGQTLRLHFRQRLREERRFAGPEALAAQIQADIAQATAILAGER